MYKVEINIADWDFVEDEKLVIQTTDFEKVQIIQEFIEMQKEYGWAVDYVAVQEFAEDEDEEFADEYCYDEDSDVWCMYDDEEGAWYWYDEDEDMWVLCEEQGEDESEEDESEEDESEEDESEEDESEEDEASTVTTFVVVKVEE
jgi:hypothetical protein